MFAQGQLLGMKVRPRLPGASRLCLPRCSCHRPPAVVLRHLGERKSLPESRAIAPARVPYVSRCADRSPDAAEDRDQRVGQGGRATSVLGLPQGHAACLCDRAKGRPVHDFVRRGAAVPHVRQEPARAHSRRRHPYHGAAIPARLHGPRRRHPARRWSCERSGPQPERDQGPTRARCTGALLEPRLCDVWAAAC